MYMRPSMFAAWHDEYNMVFGGDDSRSGKTKLGGIMSKSGSSST
jgi:uncharacterized protein with NRDE domain